MMKIFAAAGFVAAVAAQAHTPTPPPHSGGSLGNICPGYNFGISTQGNLGGSGGSECS